MATIDLTIETDTREFFRKLGITDDAALDALAVALGETRDIGHLQHIQALVAYGCFIDRDTLVRTLSYDCGAHDEADVGVQALANLRGLKTVSTAEAVREHLGSDLPDYRVKAFVTFLGENTPEWFWPMVIMLAAASQEFRFGPDMEFRRSLNGVFAVLGHDVLDTLFDPAVGVIHDALGLARWELSTRELTESERRWFIPAAVGVGYDDYDDGQSEEEF
jgi:hypothetical protein